MIDKLSLLIMLAIFSGCSVPLFLDSEGYENSCDSNAACGINGVCSAGQCVATDADLNNVYVLVDLPTTSAFGPGSWHLVPLDDSVKLSNPKGIKLYGDVELKELVEVSATMAVTTNIAGCAEELQRSQGRVPFALELYPTSGAAGLPLPAVTKGPNPASEKVTAQVSVGTYDIYLRPKPFEGDSGTPSSCNGAIPPILLKSQELLAGTVDVSPVANEEPTELQGTFDTPNLEGWSVVVIDNKTRYAVSTVSQPTTVGSKSVFSVRYWPDDSARRIIRLSPPAALTAQGVPDMLWDPAVIDTDGDNIVDLALADMLEAEAKKVEGVVLSSIGDEPVPATLRIRSISIDGADAFQSFRLTAETDKDGRFSVKLRPGTYAMTAAPADSVRHAVATEQWTISEEDLGSGKTISVNEKSDFSARVLKPNTMPAVNVPVLLESSTDQAQTLLQEILEPDAPLAVNSAAATNAAGVFSLAVDPGYFNLSVQPAADSGWPWLVRQSIGVATSEPLAETSLGDLTLSSPVILKGVVRSPAGAPLPHATIRVFVVQPSSEETSAPAALNVAATKSSAAGSFQLLLPPQLGE